MTSVTVCQLLHQWVACRSGNAAHVVVVSGHHDVAVVSPRCTPTRKKEKSNSFIFFCCFSVGLRYNLNHREPQHFKVSFLVCHFDHPQHQVSSAITVSYWLQLLFTALVIHSNKNNISLSTKRPKKCCIVSARMQPDKWHL